jgi:hypothetical protein
MHPMINASAVTNTSTGHGGVAESSSDNTPVTKVLRRTLSPSSARFPARGETTRCSLRRVSAMGTPLVQLSHPARLRGAESGTA